MSAVRPTTSTGGAVPGLLAAVVVSIVLGILGMHALSTHGVMGGADHGGHAAMGDDTGGASSDPADSPAVGGHDTGGMVMLCAAMLAATAAAALLLLTHRTRRTPRFWALLPAATTTTTTTGVTPRLGTGPPPVWAFSVIRR
ncbi:DUF6153 family protein [Nocardioides aquaticus]|uniref:DUF6153 family protein n=1 Tax=Nocardioides aquaticus TaxID=160826 RepID=UPI001BD2F448|nr:DUF6153 family protein [Nocardioides aquaticus]